MRASASLPLPSDDFRGRMPNFQEPMLSQNLAFAINERPWPSATATAAKSAIAWALLRHPSGNRRYSGMRKSSQEWTA